MDGLGVCAAPHPIANECGTDCGAPSTGAFAGAAPHPFARYFTRCGRRRPYRRTPTTNTCAPIVRWCGTLTMRFRRVTDGRILHHCDAYLLPAGNFPNEERRRRGGGGGADNDALLSRRFANSSLLRVKLPNHKLFYACRLAVCRVITIAHYTVVLSLASTLIVTGHHRQHSNRPWQALCYLSW